MLDLPSEREVGRAIGARVRAARLARGLSQVRLGAALGLSFQQMQKYEKAANRIPAERLMLISLVLDVPLMDFYGGATPAMEEDPYRRHLYRLIETMAQEYGQPMEDPSPSGLEP